MPRNARSRSQAASQPPRGEAKTAHTYCRICEAACGLVATVEGDRVTKLVPDRTNPISRGFACAKGTRFAEVAYHRDRLLEPMQRSNDGALRRTSWDDANRTVISRLLDIQRQHGKHAVGLYFGNPIAFNAQAAFALPAFTKLLATRNVFSAGSQDCNNKFAGARLVYGSPLIQPFPDIDRTELAVVLGSNPYVSQASFVHLAGGSLAFQRLVDRGGHVVWVDPVRTESAARWGEHLAIRPGTDALLLCGLLSLLAPERGSVGADGLDELVAQARTYSLDRISVNTGIPAKRIVELAEMIRKASRTAFHISVGVNQGGHGTLSFVLLQALAFVTDNLDSEGGLLFHPIARSAARAFESAGLDDIRRSRVGGFESNMGTLPAALMADEILEEGPERVRALIVVAGDPRVSVPGGERLDRALAELEFLVCIDMFENETGKLADVLLPTTSWLERWDVATTSLQFQRHGRVPTAGPVVSPVGNCRNDAHILCDLARGLGGSQAFRLGGLGLDRWLPSPKHGLPFPKAEAGHSASAETPRFWAPPLAEEFERLRRRGPPPEWMLMGRRRRRGHNSWIHGGARDDPERAAWLHPNDMHSLGLRDGDQIEIRSETGAITIEVRSNPGLMRGTVVVPHGIPSANVNALFPTGHESIERASGMVTLTGVGVSVRAIVTHAGLPAARGVVEGSA